MDLERRVAKLTAILDVAKALSAEHDLDTLLSLIVTSATQVVDADRCTLFVRDRDTGELWSRVAQGLTSKEIRLPCGHGIAGQVAECDEVLCIDDPYNDPRFNPDVDRRTGYQTNAILCVPMRGPRGEVVGVLQALNPDQDDAFSEDDAELLLALGGQAAAALQNAFLYDEIDRLFEGLVRASIVAIESRDPATSGHSERVAAMTVRLAEAINGVTEGPYADTHFSPAELREIRFSTMLHDMGKVGVREAVLVKAQKLYPGQMARVRERLNTARAAIQRDHYKALFELAQRADFNKERQAEAENGLGARLEELDAIEAFIDRVNRPYPMDDGARAELDAISDRLLPAHHEDAPLFHSSELELLHIERGSLSGSERAEIESHVTHSYNFLVQIPWTKDLARVPEIAWGHHEKLNGTGYPRGVGADQIPVETRMMTIADIYDALTASDRPYKKSLSHQMAVSILTREAESGGVDPDLLRHFLEFSVPRHAIDKEDCP